MSGTAGLGASIRQNASKYADQVVKRDPLTTEQTAKDQVKAMDAYIARIEAVKVKYLKVRDENVRNCVYYENKTKTLKAELNRKDSKPKERVRRTTHKRNILKKLKTQTPKLHQPLRSPSFHSHAP